MPQSGHRLRHFLKEVRRRRVVQVAAAYLAAGWIVIEASATITPELPLPGWTPRAVILVVLFGFPVALVFVVGLSTSRRAACVARNRWKRSSHA